MEHGEYDGTVGLDGMKPNELKDRVFHSIISDSDADRVVSCIHTAIDTMVLEDDDIDEE